VLKKILAQGIVWFIFFSSLVLLVAITTIKEAEKQLHKNLEEALLTRVQGSAAGLRDRFALEKQSALAWSRDKSVQNNTLLLLNVASSPTLLTINPAQFYFRNFFSSQLAQGKFDNYLIINKEHLVLASKNNSEIGTYSIFRDNPKLTDNSWSGNTVIIIPTIKFNEDNSEKRSHIFVLSPIMADDSPVALMVFDYEYDSLMSSLDLHGQIGKSGKTQVFDQQGNLISKATYSKVSITNDLMASTPYWLLSDWLHKNDTPSPIPLTISGQNPLMKRSGINMQGYQNHRGTTVIGTWLWDEALNLGLLTEMDKNEAYLVLIRQAQVILIATAVIIGLILLITLLIFHGKYRNLKSQAKLESLVQERTAQLEIETNNAIQANREKSQFLANMSHELRTPMHAILSFSALAQKKTDDPQQITEFVQHIRNSAIRLLSLINDLLDISRLESGKAKINFDENDLTTLIENAINEVSGLMMDHKITLNFDNSKRIECVLDSKMISQVLINLLSNAIKFSPVNSTIDLNIKQTSKHFNNKQQDIIEITLIDQGLGIPKDEVQKIFDKFVQSSKTRSGAGGTGLGLPISKQIIDLHHGQIWAESPPPGRQTGTAIHVVLPVLQDILDQVGITNIDEAIESHKKWVHLIDELFEKENTDIDIPSSVMIDHNSCSLGQWIHSKRIASDNLPQLNELHQKFHFLVAECVAYYRISNYAEAREKQNELHIASDGIIHILEDIRLELADTAN